MIDLSLYVDALDDNPFEEIPVDLDTFIGQEYLGDHFVLSPIQRELVECMSQIYTLEDCTRIYGHTEGINHYRRYTKKEIIQMLGKGCSAGTDEVFLADSGKWSKIEDLQSIPNNVVAGSANGDIINQYATESFIEGNDMTYLVEIERGLEMTVTMDHAFYDIGMNRVKLRDLKVGDRIATIAKTTIDDPVRIDDREVKLLGYWIGDGMMPADHNKVLNQDFGNNDRLALNDYIEICQSYNASYLVTKNPNGKQMTCVRSHRNSPLHNVVYKHGLWGARANNKRIPDAVWSLPDDQLADFLGKLWGTDGRVYPKKSRNRTHWVLEYTTISKELAVGMQRLLTRFGVLASLRSRIPTYVYNGEKRAGQRAYCLTISDKTGVERFAQHINLMDKQPLLDQAVAKYADQKAVTGRYIGDLYFGKIKAIREVMPQPVFTMTATETGNFNQNLVLNGNSGK